MTYAVLTGLFLLLTIVGTIVWYLGATHREGHSVHCYKCEHNLAGGPLTECPRCMTPQPENKILIGERAPRPMWILGGRICLVLALAAIVPVLLQLHGKFQAEWYCFRPTFMVLRELEGGALASRAMDELATRCRIGQLSPPQAGQAIEIVLAGLAAPETPGRPLQGLRDLAATFVEAGHFSASQTLELFEALDDVNYAFVPGDRPEGGSVRLTGGIFPPNGWVPRRMVRVVELDGQPADQVIFERHDYPAPSEAGFAIREAAVSFAVRESIRFRVTTAWQNFKADLISEDLAAATGPRREVLLARLTRLIPRPLVVYEQEFEFGEFTAGQARLIEYTDRRLLQVTPRVPETQTNEPEAHAPGTGSASDVRR